MKKSIIALFLVLISASSFANELSSEEELDSTEYKSCWIDSYDSCPSAAQWKCTKWKVYGKTSSNWVSEIAGPFGKEANAYTALNALRGSSCP